MEYLQSVIDHYRPTGTIPADERRAFFEQFYYRSASSYWEFREDSSERIYNWAEEQLRKVIVPGPAGDMVLKHILRELFYLESGGKSYDEMCLEDYLDEVFDEDLWPDAAADDDDSSSDGSSIHECELCKEECCSERYVGMCDNDCGVEHMCSHCATTNTNVGKVLCPNCADKFPASDTE